MLGFGPQGAADGLTWEPFVLIVPTHLCLDSGSIQASVLGEGRTGHGYC